MSGLTRLAVICAGATLLTLDMVAATFGGEIAMWAAVCLMAGCILALALDL